MNKRILLAYVIVALTILSRLSIAQGIGERARLESTNPKGVPVHVSATDAGFVRWVNGTLVKVVAVEGNWYQVNAEGREGWVTKSYVFKVEGTDFDPEPTEAETQFYVIGTWNLEWFNDAKSRGFPEYNQHGPK